MEPGYGDRAWLPVSPQQTRGSGTKSQNRVLLLPTGRAAPVPRVTGRWTASRLVIRLHRAAEQCPGTREPGPEQGQHPGADGTLAGSWAVAVGAGAKGNVTARDSGSGGGSLFVPGVTKFSSGSPQGGEGGDPLRPTDTGPAAPNSEHEPLQPKHAWGTLGTPV